MGLLDLRRIPEPEIMSGEEEAEAYASATALKHLESLDDSFVERALTLGVASGIVLDVGTGPGQIPIKLALRNPALIIHAIDLAHAMLRRAALDAGRWGVDMRILLNYGDAKEIPYDRGLFDMVLCNSVLHHVADPVRLIEEMARVCKTEGALLLRDLRRPNRVAYRYHVRKHGRCYDGRMRQLFEASVRSAYTLDELRELARKSGVPRLEVLRMGPAHIGIQRPAKNNFPAETQER
jgi:ubiquinone/menaquinone biosynthesis C-methylase UbiE